MPLRNADEVLDIIYKSIEQKGREYTLKQLLKGIAKFHCPASFGLPDRSRQCMGILPNNGKFKPSKSDCYNCWDNAL